ncbi:MerR family transcriptional regulator [Leptobacterium sp. I13]|uniref:MerR family transcriptional regulator n=1 Tax=Leptobacterium meishanense TaxID=3128904 RepID=UPI0030EB6494
MNNIITKFSIKDLENLSGIKAHTIRIWEKRYNILTPSRTDSNIRYYDVKSLQKLLNVTLLYNAGVKISKIAKYDKHELQSKVREHVSKNENPDHSVALLKMAMLNFDQSLFEQTYNQLVADTSFRTVFLEVFVPILHNIGLQWQSDAIIPAHERFITNLIMQKLHVNIERAQKIAPVHTDKTYVLYLPVNETHELGLLYIHYELLVKGYRSIYLGPSVPIDNLKTVQDSHKRICFISYFTVQPILEDILVYLKEMNEELLLPANNELWILGRKTENIVMPPDWKYITKFNAIQDLLNKV